MIWEHSLHISVDLACLHLNISLGPSFVSVCTALWFRISASCKDICEHLQPFWRSSIERLHPDVLPSFHGLLVDEWTWGCVTAKGRVLPELQPRANGYWDGVQVSRCVTCQHDTVTGGFLLAGRADKDQGTWHHSITLWVRLWVATVTLLSNLCSAPRSLS